MNVITYNTAYSLYPYATFARRDSLVLSNHSRAQEALMKYATRGWRILANPSPLNARLVRSKTGNGLYSLWFHIDTPRWVCDDMSWTIHLDTAGVTFPPLLSPSSEALHWDPVAECGWKLSLLDPVQGQVVLSYAKVKSTVFRWQYTSPEYGYVDTLKGFMVSQGKMEHSKIPSGKEKADIAEAWTW